jgi:hypothetical protein
MKNYSSNVASPDQVKAMMDEVDRRQTEEIEKLKRVNKVSNIVIAVMIGSIIGCMVMIASTMKRVDRLQDPITVVQPVEAASK